jgi:hypothetical protein
LFIWLFYYTVPTASNEGNFEFGDMRGNGHACFKVLSQHFVGGIEETHG